MAIDYPPVFINKYLAEKIPADLPDYFSGSEMRFFPTQPTTIDTFTEEFPESASEPFAVYDRMFRMRRNPFPHKRTEQLLYYFYKTSGGIEALVETVQAVADLLDDGSESAEDLNLWIRKKFKESPGEYLTRKKIKVTSRSLADDVALLTTDTSHGLAIGDKIVVSGVGTAFDTSLSNPFYTVLDVPSVNTIKYEKTNIDVANFSTQSGAYVGLAHPTLRFNDKDFFLPYFHETKIYQLEEARDIIDFGTARTYAGNKIIIEYCWHKSSPRK
jgi:hypothetical protein